MKNLRMKMKLLISFSIVVALSVVVGATGIVGLSDISIEAGMINIIHENSLMVQKLQTNLETQRSLYRDATLRAAVNVRDGLEEELRTIETLDVEAMALIDYCHESFTQQETRAMLSDIDESYNEFAQARDQLISDLRSEAPIETLIVHLGEAAGYAETLGTYTGTLTSFASQLTDEMADDVEVHAAFLSKVMLIILVISAGLSLVLERYISSLITRPAAKLVEAANKLSVGDIDVDLAIDSKDEMGQLAVAFQNMAAEAQRQAMVLSMVADGDYSQEIPVRSAQDLMNSALNEMIARSNDLIHKIRQSAIEIDDGAAQIAQASQSLAAGSSEQAATMEQFTVKVTEISEKRRPIPPPHPRRWPITSTAIC